LGKRNKERIIPFSLELKRKIEAYLAARTAGSDGYLIVTVKGKKMYEKLVYNIVKRYLSLVTTIDKKSPHVLRHTFATHMLNNGAELNAIKELLGHANLSATQIYTHNTVEKLKNIHKQAHPRS
jgi:integrase/recombinase XerC